jgi:hypothetical protein
MRFSDKSYLLLMLALSLGANVWLTSRLYSKAAPTVPRLAQGTRLSPFEVRTLTGEKVSLQFEGQAKPTLLYFFSAQCSWCIRNHPNIRMVAEKAADYRRIGIATNKDGLPDYLASHPVGFDAVYVDVAQDTLRKYGLEGTPHTLLLSRDGLVLKNWPGAFPYRSGAEVASYFGIVLPGLVDVP